MIFGSKQLILSHFWPISWHFCITTLYLWYFFSFVPCAVHDTQYCNACDAGYRLDEEYHICPVNQCECTINSHHPNLGNTGIPALGPDTMPCNNNVTTNPNNFGTLNNPDCDSTEASLLCPNHGDLVCATCFSGYHLDNYSAFMSIVRLLCSSTFMQSSGTVAQSS